MARLSPYIQHPKLFNHLIWLSNSERQEPWKVISEFFQANELYELRDFLYSVQLACITSDLKIFDEGDKRLVLIITLEEMERFFEATYLALGERRV